VTPKALSVDHNGSDQMAPPIRQLTTLALFGFSTSTFPKVDRMFPKVDRMFPKVD
jgi:hypothetical protein